MGCFEARPLQGKNYFEHDLNTVGAQCMFQDEDAEFSSIDALQYLFQEGQGDGVYGEWDTKYPIEQRKIVVGADLKFVSQRKNENYTRNMLGMLISLLQEHQKELENEISKASDGKITMIGNKYSITEAQEQLKKAIAIVNNNPHNVLGSPKVVIRTIMLNEYVFDMVKARIMEVESKMGELGIDCVQTLQWGCINQYLACVISQGQSKECADFQLEGETVFIAGRVSCHNLQKLWAGVNQLIFPGATQVYSTKEKALKSLVTPNEKQHLHKVLYEVTVNENQKPLDVKKVFAKMDVVPENQCDGVVQRLAGKFQSIAIENLQGENIEDPQAPVVGKINTQEIYVLKVVQKESPNCPNMKSEKEFKEQKVKLQSKQYYNPLPISEADEKEKK